VDTSTAGTSALKTVAGPWRVEVTLVDLVGKVREPIATELDWQHEPLGAPVRVSLVGQPVWPYMPANAKLWERSLGDSDLAAALNGLGAGNGLAVVEYLVENGTSEDVNVFLFVAPPQAGSVVASTTYVDRSPVLEYLKGGKVIPNVKCEFFRILSSGFFECSGSGGWTKPSPKDKEDSSGWDASAYFIDGVRVFREVTTIDELSPCAGCATTLPGSIQAGREFTIKAGQRYHVMMVAEDLHFLAPPAASGAIFMEALAPTGGTVPITHTLGEVWGQCTSWASPVTALGPPPPPPPPPDDKCVAQTKFQRYQALKSARLKFAYDQLDLKLRTRPAVTAGLVMPEYEKDDDSNKSQTLPDWATCEGTLAGTTCIATAGAFP
jgi:hypothetical protein